MSTTCKFLTGSESKVTAYWSSLWSDFSRVTCEVLMFHSCWWSKFLFPTFNATFHLMATYDARDIAPNSRNSSNGTLRVLGQVLNWDASIDFLSMQTTASYRVRTLHPLSLEIHLVGCLYSVRCPQNVGYTAVAILQSSIHL